MRDYDIIPILQEHDRMLDAGERNACIIIAKKLSSRYPGKNVVPFCGRPLSAWSVIQAVNSHLITDTYMATNDEEIADISRDFGAQIIWRSEELDNGLVANIPYRTAIRQVQEYHPVTRVATLLPTTVLRHPWDIDSAILEFVRRAPDDNRVFVVQGLVENLETMVYELLGEREARIIIANKKSKYGSQGGGVSVHYPDGYITLTNDVPNYDNLVDREFIGYNKAVHGPTQRLYYYRVEDYQGFDLDLPEQKPLMEQIMETCILNGNQNAYTEYKTLAKLKR